MALTDLTVNVGPKKMTYVKFVLVTTCKMFNVKQDIANPSQFATRATEKNYKQMMVVASPSDVSNVSFLLLSSLTRHHIYTLAHIN